MWTFATQCSSRTPGGKRMDAADPCSSFTANLAVTHLSEDLLTWPGRRDLRWCRVRPALDRSERGHPCRSCACTTLRSHSMDTRQDPTRASTTRSVWAALGCTNG